VFKERAAFVHKIMFLIDVILLSTIFLLALVIRGHLHRFYHFDFFPSSVIVQDFGASQDSYLTVMLIIIPLWCVSLYWSGMYRSMRLKTALDVVGVVIKSSFITATTFSVLAFMLKMEFISRTFLILFIIMASLTLILEKACIYFLISYTRKQGYNFRRLLLVGTGKRAAQFISKIRAHPEWGLKIMGVLDYEHERICSEFEDIEILGMLKDMEAIIRRKSIDEVVFIVPRSKLVEMENYLYICETVGVKCTVAVDLFHLKIARLTQTEFDGLPMITFETTSSKEWQLFIKRIMDFVISGIGIVLLSPIFLTVAIIIKLVSPGPVFYRQKRIGLNGRRFVFLKFRSMCERADLQLAKLMGKNEMSGPVFKIKNDPRIYPFGGFLRKFSIDELPQLFHVFFGQMNLVGPRPPVFREVRQYEPWQRRRLSMRPGITCLWQVSGRNKITFAEWMKLDLEYIDNWSLWLDFRILIRTIPAVLFGHNAY
jgi:exopolysaccharide biosynthesis polyprenyl glycosylphosphotransferase